MKIGTKPSLLIDIKLSLIVSFGDENCLDPAVNRLNVDRAGSSVLSYNWVGTPCKLQQWDWTRLVEFLKMFKNLMNFDCLNFWNIWPRNWLKLIFAPHCRSFSLLISGYDKVSKHASIACRQLTDFVSKETKKKENHEENKEKPKN